MDRPQRVPSINRVDASISGEELRRRMESIRDEIIASMDSYGHNLDKQRAALEARYAEFLRQASAAAAQGDRSENADLQIAYDGMSQTRITLQGVNQQLALLKNSSKTEKTVDGTINVGMTVCIADVTDTNGQLTTNSPHWVITLYPAGLGNAKIGAITVGTPLGRSLLGRSRGETITVDAPARTMQYFIKEVY